MKKKLVSLMLVAIMVASTLVGCGGGSGKTKSVSFMYSGDAGLAEIYGLLINEFNETVGKEEGVSVKGVPKSGTIDSVLAQQLPSNSGPDVVSVSDKYFKKYTKYFEPVDKVVEQSVLDDFYDSTIERYHYDIETNTSNDDDPLYGLPAYNDATVLYYNKSVLEKLGVICISVNEEDLDAFNSGEADLKGKTKADYGIDIDVPAKGFYRSIAPYVAIEGDTAGSSWTKPVSGEVLIFNDRIAMNWDEIEDIAMICTKEKNAASPSQYGYYTEWWFNYGWSVGGDCLEDLSGEGDWKYTLAGNNPNYIVEEGKTYTGVYTGKVYEENDTLDLKDVLDAKAGDKISYETDGKSYYHYTVNGQEAAMRDLSAEVANGTLTELPSIRDAFSRFTYLAGIGGLNASPYPSAFNSTSASSYFATGNLAFLIEYVSNAQSIDKIMEDEWDMAPLPQFKEYTDPSDPACDEIAREGRISSHSLGYAVCVNVKSEVKEEAFVFLNWLATEGQTVLADNGYLSSHKSDAETVLKNLPLENSQAVLDSVASCSAGDWWYMQDNAWISTWSDPLNSQVRYGKMKLDDFLYGYIEETNEDLLTYK